MLEKIKYECSKCGWSASVPEQWGDVKPAYCGNQKCEYSKSRAPKTKKSFRLFPDVLKVAKPVKNADSAPAPEKKVKRRKSKGSSDVGQQSESASES